MKSDPRKNAPSESAPEKTAPDPAPSMIPAEPLSLAENEVMNLLATAYLKFSELPVVRETDLERFRQDIQHLQDMIMARPVINQINQLEGAQIEEKEH